MNPKKPALSLFDKLARRALALDNWQWRAWLTASQIEDEKLSLIECRTPEQAERVAHFEQELQGLIAERVAKGKNPHVVRREMEVITTAARKVTEASKAIDAGEIIDASQYCKPPNLNGGKPPSKKKTAVLVAIQRLVNEGRKQRLAKVREWLEKSGVEITKSDWKRVCSEVGNPEPESIREWLLKVGATVPKPAWSEFLRLRNPTFVSVLRLVNESGVKMTDPELRGILEDPSLAINGRPLKEALRDGRRRGI